MAEENSLEIWKDIPGFERSYQASNKGQIRSLDRTINHPNGLTRRKGKLLKQSPRGERRNYPSLELFSVGYAVHRLVAMTFIPNPENKSEVNHIDGNTFNNSVENLEWCTSTENVRHAVRTGLLVRGTGKDCCNTKYAVLVYKDKQFVTRLIGTKEIIEFGLTPGKVSLCVIGKRKQHRGYTYEAEYFV